MKYFLLLENITTDYIDQKFKQLQKKTQNILFAKRSILYDIDNKIMEVKNTIIINSQSVTSQISIEKSKETLAITLPTVSVDHFLQLENLLKDSPEKKEALVNKS